MMDTLPQLPKLSVRAHKGDFGHVLVIGGDYGTCGAVILAASAALRAGAGMVTVATRPDAVDTVVAAHPELMTHAIHSPKDLIAILDKATVCVLGPGLGLSDWSKAVFQQVLSSKKDSQPMVVDASALRLLANMPSLSDHWVLTPHPGEAADMLKITTTKIQSKRAKAVDALARKYGGTIILKGHHTLVQSGLTPAKTCTSGNSAMAVAGMGDVLSGLIAGLIGQGLSPADAALASVWVHATAGDQVALKLGGRGMLAMDVVNQLPYVINELLK